MRIARIAGALLAATAVGTAVLPAALGLAAPAPGPVAIKARDFLFDPREVTARAGEVTFEIRNEGAIEHNFVVEDANRRPLAEIAIIDAGKTATVKASLRLGTYPFACTLPGHREAGMAGVLRVQP
jgi:uncharacterized cupredoxin-like copper-binding protein